MVSTFSENSFCTKTRRDYFETTKPAPWICYVDETVVLIKKNRQNQHQGPPALNLHGYAIQKAEPISPTFRKQPPNDKRNHLFRKTLVTFPRYASWLRIQRACLEANDYVLAIGVAKLS